MKKLLLLSCFLFVLVGCGHKTQQTTEKPVEEFKKEVPAKEEVVKEEIKKEELNENLIDNNWKEVNHSNFWRDSNIVKGGDYNFANIKFSYPSNMEFECCLDRGDGSEHVISGKNGEKISLFDYALAGCPSNKNNCGLEELIVLKSEDKFKEIRNNFLKNKFKEYSINLNSNENIEIVCFINDINKDKDCLLKTDKSVVGFTFKNENDDFIKIFFDKVSIDN